MFNQNRVSFFNKAIFLLVLLLISLVLIFGGVFIIVAIMSASIVPLTWVYGLISGQSYNRVCDNSEIVYRLNQLGKWTIVVGISILFGYFLYKFI